MRFNRPQRMNSLSFKFTGKPWKAWERFRDDEDSWVAIVIAAGTKVFCAGLDLSKADKLRVEHLFLFKQDYDGYNLADEKRAYQAYRTRAKTR